MSRTPPGASNLQLGCALLGASQPQQRATLQQWPSASFVVVVHDVNSKQCEAL
jgi:hypothetical protein